MNGKIEIVDCYMEPTARLARQGKAEMKGSHTVEMRDEGRIHITGESNGVKFNYQVVVTSEGLIIDAVETDNEVLDSVTAVMHADYWSADDQ